MRRRTRDVALYGLAWLFATRWRRLADIDLAAGYEPDADITEPGAAAPNRGPIRRLNSLPYWLTVGSSRYGSPIWNS